MPDPDPETLRAAVDTADRYEESCELAFYTAAERALHARTVAQHTFGSRLGLDGERIGPRAAHAPVVLRRFGATLAAAATAKRKFELASLQADARRRALLAAELPPED